jgi:general secretion pathway protein B
VSLILDALRRADSERERGSVPGLHAQPALPLAADAPQRPRAERWQWVAIGLTVGLLASIAWYIFGRDAPPALTEPADLSRSAAPPAAAVAPSAASEAPRASPAPAAPPRPGPSDLQVVAEPAPWPMPENRQAAARAPAPAAARERPAANTEQPVVSSPSEPPILARDQLPENIRAQLPQLTVGGSIYSSRAADRSVIINGRIFRENDQLTADLALEQIKLKAAVLKFKGYRFEIQF